MPARQAGVEGRKKLFPKTMLLYAGAESPRGNPKPAHASLRGRKGLPGGDGENEMVQMVEPSADSCR